MTLIKITDVLDELIVFLRNNVTDPSSRGTDTSQTYTATASQTSFVITTNYPFNVSSVTVDGDAQTFGTEYTFDYATKTLTLVTGATEDDEVIISYHYSATWIFPDFPRLDLTISSYPRICVSSLARSDEWAGLGLNGLNSVFTFTVSLFFRNRRDIIEIVDTIKQLFWDNRKGFYSFTGVSPVGDAGPGIDPARKGEVFVMDMDFTIPIQAQV